MSRTQFPSRYEPVECLGKGGGGEVWSARDRLTQRVVALKLLREKADDAEILALVREATMLSGIEGLDVPRVLHFGRLPNSERAYMVREMVEGKSLADLLDADTDVGRCLSAVARVADLLTSLHRSSLLHGDVKPANIIVGEGTSATLVDLGLAAHWQEGGATPEGLTPRYAAPELFRGEALTPRGEVFALGATLGEVLRRATGSLDARQREEVDKVVAAATADDPDTRYPSADEFAVALRSAAKLDAPSDRHKRAWSILGLDGPANQLIEQVRSLEAGAGLVVTGPTGSGRSTLLRRVAWSLGVAGVAVALIEACEVDRLDDAIDVVVGGRRPDQLVLILDDADKRSAEELERLDALRRAGTRLVVVVAGNGEAVKLPGDTFALFAVPLLDAAIAAVLVRRMIPSLSETLTANIVAHAGGLPGVLRTVVDRLEGAAVVSVDDLTPYLDDVHVPVGAVVPVAEIHRLLDNGRFEDAADRLTAYEGDASVSIAIARARLCTGRGEPRAALKELSRVERDLDVGAEPEQVARWHLHKSRALLRAGDYGEAEANANMALTRLGTSLLGELVEGPAGSTGNLRAGHDVGSMAADALAVCGLAQSYSARHEEAAATLRRGVEVASATADARTRAVALGSLAFALQRSDRLDDAQAAHEEALELAEKAGHAGHVATTRLNLAGIAKTRGDIAAALTHLEAAVDMGRRSGRVSTVRQALLNLANLNLYLGRRERAQTWIQALAEERANLSLGARAQLLALEAESAMLASDVELAGAKCLACVAAYEQLGRQIDAAEALLERVLLMARSGDGDAAELQEQLFRAEALLGDSGAHRALLLLARAQLAKRAGDQEVAREAFKSAIDAGLDSGQREWVWRALESRAQLFESAGDMAGAAADRRSALKVLEEIASELPRDLREVYWNDPRRRALRPVTRASVAPPVFKSMPTEVDAPTQLGSVIGEDRLSRVLEINREIAGEHDLDKLLELVTDHAIALVHAERGFVLLRSRSGAEHLSVHAARDRAGGDPHGRFSRSIAERVVESGEPFVAVDAGHDDRVSDYVSVHQLMLKSVACVPIRSRGPRPIGALYLETRSRAGAMFGEEVRTLSAFADQVAIAIETARLLQENRERARELEKANRELEAARAKLEDSLGKRTEQLQTTRRNLRSARAVLRSRFGYRGIVGNSQAMRRVYAIIERVKDAEVPVLITGESGTGKEIIARAIHNAGPRAKQRFVGVNCGAIPEHLLESELFGHVRGAFTGADRDKKGLFRDLDKGTILLDEIGEMPAKMQAGLLRVLQERVVRPVGGTVEEEVGTRVIAATHRNLARMVAAGSYREDLYYRLNVIELRVPALRDRLDDVPMLIDHFLRLFAARYQREKRGVTRDALKRLVAYHWPGNVRQLENVLLNAWILSDEADLVPGDFELPAETRPVASNVSELRARPASLDDRTAQEKERILEALSACNWNRAKAAEQLGMPRRTFYRRLKKYDIQ